MDTVDTHPEVNPLENAAQRRVRLLLAGMEFPNQGKCAHCGKELPHYDLSQGPEAPGALRHIKNTVSLDDPIDPADVFFLCDLTCYAALDPGDAHQRSVRMLERQKQQWEARRRVAAISPDGATSYAGE